MDEVDVTDVGEDVIVALSSHRPRSRKGGAQEEAPQLLHQLPHQRLNLGRRGVDALRNQYPPITNQDKAYVNQNTTPLLRQKHYNRNTHSATLNSQPLYPASSQSPAKYIYLGAV